MKGWVFGLLTVDYYISQGNWMCKCSCGNTKKIAGFRLREQNVRCCGCTRPKRHGLRDKPEYRSWKAMKTRCYNPNCQDYHNYGERGIKVCDRWLNDPEAFIADMGPKPSPTYSLDRIDVNSDYSPENCRWATPKEQANNQRDFKKGKQYEYNGKSQSLIKWAREVGMDDSALFSRINRGWSFEDAITKPVEAQKRFTKEEENEIIYKYNNGCSMEELGRQYSRNSSAIIQMLQREGIWQRKKK